MHMQQLGAGARRGLLLGRTGREDSDTPVGTSREEAAPRRAASIQQIDTGVNIHPTVRDPPTPPTTKNYFSRFSPGITFAQRSMSPRVLFALCLLACSDAFTLSSGRSLAGVQHHSTVAMGLFDGLKKAFTNEEFKEDDQRVQCRHVLLKGDDDVER